MTSFAINMKINIILYIMPSSKVIADEKGIPKTIKASMVSGTAIGEIDTTTAAE
jgi:hypothetical protein